MTYHDIFRYLIVSCVHPQTHTHTLTQYVYNCVYMCNIAWCYSKREKSPAKPPKTNVDEAECSLSTCFICFGSFSPLSSTGQPGMVQRCAGPGFTISDQLPKHNSHIFSLMFNIIGLILTYNSYNIISSFFPIFFSSFIHFSPLPGSSWASGDTKSANGLRHLSLQVPARVAQWRLPQGARRSPLRWDLGKFNWSESNFYHLLSSYIILKFYFFIYISY